MVTLKIGTFLMYIVAIFLAVLLGTMIQERGTPKEAKSVFLAAASFTLLATIMLVIS